MLDQSFHNQIHTLSAAITYDPGSQPVKHYAGQTFRAGISGLLTEVRLGIRDIIAPAPPDLRVTIFDAPGGVPTDDVLGSWTLDRDYSGINDPVKVSPAVLVLAGHHYLIAADYPEFPSGTTTFHSAWDGRIENVYADGRLYWGTIVGPGDISWMPSLPPYDLFFQTYVDPDAIPEPSSFVILSVAVLMSAAFRQT